MFRYALLAALFFGAPLTSFEAKAQSTVECQSRNYQYDECWAGPLAKPQLIHQVSGAPCILNRTWGYNPKSKYIWVAQGCQGVFADVSGYHHGRRDTFDQNARMYDQRGHDAGAVVGGAILGALIEGMTDDSKRKHHHTTSNYRGDDGYNGCHGVGCMVDNPDRAADDTPQFDNEGEPNFDTHGNYQGCHGAGCLVDDPGDSDNSE
ncbi:DUF3011 domain-containing protein [Agrobacterium tumefaciens]|uniref:DUF3011 domain-containing protein n=1 Tax=Agrobacterium tumefaciens TaxID=358 RepID=UPI0015730B8D|nr:DUF3011 domain-containing protein [Agrobacterium tumefaciens]NTA84435.1 DUF3011 domain-containing protein [Agrobacterium tumefaciens]UXT84653.1 DUF3011 domain-containing protein [Agrobacterium tumefaciens]